MEKTMNQEEIFAILAEEEISKYLENMSQVHMYTKHYLLIAEEISEDGITFLQPLKEHRDAYDHLMRVFALSMKNVEQVDVKEYIFDNVKKAFGHEYRAFFDMADWLTYICRKYIREELSYNTKKKKYEEKFNFEETKQFINGLPYEIAKYREEKDVSNRKAVLDEVMKYKETIDRLLRIYEEVRAI